MPAHGNSGIHTIHEGSKAVDNSESRTSLQHPLQDDSNGGGTTTEDSYRRASGKEENTHAFTFDKFHQQILEKVVKSKEKALGTSTQLLNKGKTDESMNKAAQR